MVERVSEGSRAVDNFRRKVELLLIYIRSLNKDIRRSSPPRVNISPERSLHGPFRATRHNDTNQLSSHDKTSERWKGGRPYAAV